MNDKCPACGTAYEEHLGLVGTCRELMEALEAFSIVSRTSNEYMVQNTILREALERIAEGYNYSGKILDFNGNDNIKLIAREALQRAGGGE